MLSNLENPRRQLQRSNFSRREFLRYSSILALQLLTAGCEESGLDSAQPTATKTPRPESPTRTPTLDLDPSQRVEKVLVYSWKEMWEQSGGEERCWEDPDTQSWIKVWKDSVAKENNSTVFDLNLTLAFGRRLKKVWPGLCHPPNPF